MGADVLAYLFYSMMVLTDEFLMGTLQAEYIDLSIRKFSLSMEAGACLVGARQIAFGSIIPEFTINTISSLLVSKQHNILGLSTIVGSGCFGDSYSDFTLCLSVASFVAASWHGKLPFPALSVVKDYLTYIACLVLVISIVADYKVTAVEAVLLLAITPVYVVFSFKAKGVIQKDAHEDVIDREAPSPAVRVLKAPVKFVCQLGVPAYTGKTWQIGFSFFYIVSLAFAITRATVYVLERMMCHTSIPESLVGLTIISWGNNIGDIMNSAVAAKRGNALLSINAVISTQILNLIFSLGFPWTLSTLLFGQMTMSDRATQYSLYFAIVIVGASFVAIAGAGQRMSGKLGVALLVLYVGYVATEWTWLDRLSN